MLAQQQNEDGLVVDAMAFRGAGYNQPGNIYILNTFTTELLCDGVFLISAAEQQVFNNYAQHTGFYFPIDLALILSLWHIQSYEFFFGVWYFLFCRRL